MVDYLSDDKITKVTRREGSVSWGIYNLFLTPPIRLDTQLHPGLYPGLGSSLEYK